MNANKRKKYTATYSYFGLFYPKNWLKLNILYAKNIKIVLITIDKFPYYPLFLLKR